MMGNINTLLCKAVNLGFREIIKTSNFSILTSTEDDGIHCIIDGREYVISISESSEGKTISYDKSESLDISSDRITYILMNLGVSPGVKGYDYLKRAITLGLEDKSNIKCITKNLYPRLAEEFGTKATRVERSMRYAVEKSMERGDIDLLYEVFGHTMDPNKCKPTNTEFLNTIVEYYRHK